MRTNTMCLQMPFYTFIQALSGLEMVDGCETLPMMQRMCVFMFYVLCLYLATCRSSTPRWELCFWLCHNANSTPSQHQEADVVTCGAKAFAFLLCMSSL